MIKDRYNSAFMQDPSSSTSLEYLQVAREGAYTASSACGCNTRKYHGLLVVPQPQIDGEEHVLLSALEETLSCNGEAYHFGVHHYPGAYHPEGFRYIREFAAGRILRWTYEANGCLFRKELALEDEHNRLMIRYTLLKAPGTATLRLLPLLAFRNKHHVGGFHGHLHPAVEPAASGVRIRYPLYTPLYLQLSGGSLFFASPEWFYNVEYPLERERGYTFHEDLNAPGFFELKLAPGETIVLSAGLREEDPSGFPEAFSSMVPETAKPSGLKDHLLRARRHFLVKMGDDMVIKAGYYWFGSWARDTCISLPGLTLTDGDTGTFRAVVSTLAARLKDGLLPNAGIGEAALYNTADASLWLIYAMQQYAAGQDAAAVWDEYGAMLASILHHYRHGTMFNIGADDDGLISAAAEGYALTWMDAVVDGVPVTPRAGKPVEINALWYNAVCFCLETAALAGDKGFVREWEAWPEKIRTSFIAAYWDEDRKYLADNVFGTMRDWSVRPNQIFAVSLPYSPLTSAMQENVLNKVRKELLTPRGLRTLSPSDERYRGTYGGDQRTRDHAYHQGTVWPWLLGHFADAYVRVYQEAALPLLEAIFQGMEPALEEYCLHTVAEVCDGDAPHRSGGAVSQAWSVAELLRLADTVERLKKRYRRFQLTVHK